MSISAPTISQIKQFVPIASNKVLWLNTHEFLPAKPVSGAECRPLNAQDIRKLSMIKDFDISKQLADDFESLNFVGIGIFVDKKLAGLTLYSADTAPARHNKSQDKFNGTGIQLPAGTRCLIKAIVLPAFRGQRLNSAMVRHAIDHFGKDTVNAIVTTCDISNKAFLSSLLDQGFETVGKSTEFSLFGKSVYRLPKPVDSNTGEVSKEEDGCIVLCKAA